MTRLWGSARRRVDSRWLWAVVIALVVARTVLSLHEIDLPGLQQDETVFVNAATLRLPGVDISASFAGIPLMIVAYLGALKSWIYDPLFALFGTSPTTIRLPVVVIVSGGLLLLYAGLSHLVGRAVAVVAVALLCFDNSVFWLTRDDVGPNAIEFALKCAALFCIGRFARSPRRWWVVALLGCLALGVFNKLNFIWMVNAALIVSLLLIAGHRRELRAQRHLIIAWLAGLAVIYVGWGVYDVLGHVARAEGPGPAFAQRWFDYRVGTSAVLSGTWFYDYALAPLGSRTVVVWVTVVLFIVGAIAAAWRGRTRSLPIVGMAITAVLIAIQTLVTPQATAGWHYVVIYPFVTVVAVFVAYALLFTILPRTGLAQITLAGVGIAGLIYSGLLLGKYFDTLRTREPTFSAWSPAIYSLSRELQRSPAATIFTADWGIFEPLFALHPSRRYNELAFALQNPAPAGLAGVRASVVDVPGPKLIVTHVKQSLVFPDNDVHLSTALKGHLRLIRTVTGIGGVPVFDVYAYR